MNAREGIGTPESAPHGKLAHWRAGYSNGTATVLIVQRQMAHYRIAFFEALRTALALHGVRLRVANGVPANKDLGKRDVGTLSWAEPLHPRYFWNSKLCWMPFSSSLRGVDLVVVTPENKLLYNLRQQFFDRQVRFAFWGHGGNLQGDSQSWPDRKSVV